MVADGRRKSRRGALAASGIALAILVSAAAHGRPAASSHGHTPSAQAHAGASNATQGPTPPIVIQVLPSPQEVEAVAEQEAANRRILWFEPDAWVAIFTLSLTISTALLWLDTRRSANAALKAAEVAERALVELETPLPYPVITDNSVGAEFAPMARYSRLGGDGFCRPWAEVVIKNFGRTPALMKYVAVRMEHLTERSADAVYVTGADYSIKYVLATGDETREFRVKLDISDDEFLSLKEGNSHLFLSGETSFDDIFGNEWCQRFCFAWDYKGRRFMSWGPLHNNRIKRKAK